MTKSILIETCRCKLCTIKTFWLVVCTSKMKWNRLIFICSLSLHYGWNLVKQSDAEFSNSKQIYQLFLTKSFRIFLCVFVMRLIHTHYTLKRESLVGTLEAPRGVRQMNGVPQSGADRSATAESRVRANCSNRFTVLTRFFAYTIVFPKSQKTV